MTDHLLQILGPLDVPGLRSRRVRVFVPTGGKQAGPRPVLYMFDGQNIFHDEPSFAGGWHLHKAAQGLARKGHRAPVVVGIDHGGDARMEELAPFPSGSRAARTDALLDWLTGALVPRIRDEFGVSGEPGQVGIGGASLGGLAALYAHFRNPEHFGLVLAMSPSLWVAQRKIFACIAGKAKPWTSRIYLDAVALEAKGSMLGAAKLLAAALRERGWDDAGLRFVAAQRGTHSEKAWRRRAPRALEFLFPKTQG